MNIPLKGLKFTALICTAMIGASSIFPHSSVKGMELQELQQITSTTEWCSFMISQKQPEPRYTTSGELILIRKKRI
jgi:hypothetical protein